ncbi:MAG: T9SS type A sorting domain-containing protein [Bacteroidales bacterium]|nr:T9SS type A sorting domain-containing protein [Bacteroidales bacterium]MCF8377644.1 T9SS type A sorting domain-containing protein [Bacteroidales bacterium]
MKKKYFIVIMLVAVIASLGIINLAISDDKRPIREQRQQVDTRVDNNSYWIKMAEKGLATLNPDATPEKAVYKGSKIKARTVITEDSPDVPVTTQNSTQSENSIFINPNDPDNVLNSNNSTSNPASTLYGANDFYSFDAGETWMGELFGAGGSNSGDPAALIGTNGRYFVGYISNSYGQGVSYSDNQGLTWISKLVSGSGSASILDKNHLWIDNSLDSPYEGRLYDAWTPLGGSGSNLEEIEIAWSDGGESWSTPQTISDAVNAGSHNQGVNINSGPNGEVYAIWAIYDNWPVDESAIGFARSYDGGETWDPATRIIDDIRGIRITETGKNMRVNSFPVMTVDNSNGPNRGTLYVVWSNVGVPGVNQGPDMDVYMIKSTDDGDTWSEPVKVNQDEPGVGKEHYFPWITCDPVSGYLSVIFYDDRNLSSNQCEVWCANSLDGGESWEDFKVSDVAFTPQPISGLASGYFGDYLGIQALQGKVYPVWTDNRDGHAMTYVSPYEINILPFPENLTGLLAFETGEVSLDWSFEGHEDFDHFNIYRDDILVTTTSDTTYLDMLPDYGYYDYAVTASFSDGSESAASTIKIQWGDAHISVNPMIVNDLLKPGETSMHQISIYNVGELELEYYITSFIPVKNTDSREYCEASGGCDEYIQKVEIGDVSNTSNCEGYQNFTGLGTQIDPGMDYELTITNGVPYPADQCGVWIDWNQNEDFTDDAFVEVTGTPGGGPYTAVIRAPSDAATGSTRMRIRIKWSGDPPQPCGTTDYGEVEDYTLNVNNWFNVTPFEGNVDSGDSTIINVMFNAESLDIGNYFAELKISNNDPDQPEVIVPLNLAVSDLGVETTASQTEICPGGSIGFSATASGVLGQDTAFFWYSIPEGFESDEQNPVFENIENIDAFVASVTDEIATVTDTIEISYLPAPEVKLGTDTTICAHTGIVLNAGNQPGSTFEWYNGETTQQITVDSSGVGLGSLEAWVLVTNATGCSSIDSVQITFKDCTGIDETDVAVAYNIHPNPANGTFFIDMNSKEKTMVEVKVFNVSGKLVFSSGELSFSGVRRQKIDLGKESSGIYSIFIRNGNRSYSEKIIIK